MLLLTVKIVILMIAVPFFKPGYCQSTSTNSISATSSLPENTSATVSFDSNTVISIQPSTTIALINTVISSTPSLFSTTETGTFTVTSSTQGPIPASPSASDSLPVSTTQTSMMPTLQPTPTITVSSTSDYNVTNWNSTQPTTTLVSTTSTTTTTLKPDVPHNSYGSIQFNLKLSNNTNDSPDILYTNNSWTMDDLQKEVINQFQTRSPLWMSLNYSNGTYTLNTRMFYNGVNITSVNQSFYEYLQQLDNSSSSLNVSASAYTQASKFFQSALSPCSYDNICALEFDCSSTGCSHKCNRENCNGHGRCYVDVTSNLAVSTKCICDSSYDTEYSGDKCESSSTGKLQIIAIIAGVLGAAILVLFIVLLVMCCSGRRKGKAYTFDRKYDNGAYESDDK